MTPKDHEGKRELKVELDKAVLWLSLLAGVLLARWFGWIP